MKRFLLFLLAVLLTYQLHTKQPGFAPHLYAHEQIKPSPVKISTPKLSIAKPFSPITVRPSPMLSTMPAPKPSPMIATTMPSRMISTMPVTKPSPMISTSKPSPMISNMTVPKSSSNISTPKPLPVMPNTHPFPMIPPSQSTSPLTSYNYNSFTQTPSYPYNLPSSPSYAYSPSYSYSNYPVAGDLASGMMVGTTGGLATNYYYPNSYGSYSYMKGEQFGMGALVLAMIVLLGVVML